MTRLQAVAHRAVRARYVLLVICALGCTVPGYFLDSHRFWSDWIIFEIGARTLTHWHHLPIYSGSNPLHLYDNDPVIQIGPPPLLLLAGTQWLPPHVVSGFWVIVMALMGVGSVGFIEATARRLDSGAHATRIRAISLVAGLPLVAAWSYENSHFHHLDDALALLAISAAMWLCASGRSAWVVGILLGLAAASKPWAIVAAPMLLGLPREGRSKACLGFVATAAAFWGPFMVGAPDTIQSLGGYRIIPQPGSIPYLFGMHGHVQGWLRETQFAVGIGLAALVAHRRSWLAAPLVGMAGRVLFDPYVFAYYGLGPVLFALAWDLARPTQRRLPVWTAWTLFIEFGLRLFAPASLCATGRLIWVLTVFGALVLNRRSTTTVEMPVTTSPSAELVTA